MNYYPGPTSLPHYPQSANTMQSYIHMDAHGAAMDEQERRKLERKRLRNRVAASKCRQKKLERIADLEAQVADQKKVTAQLETDIIACRRLLEQIEHEVKQHYARGCQQHTNFGYMLKPKH